MEELTVRELLRRTTAMTYPIIDGLLEQLSNANDEDKERIFAHIAWHIPSGGPKMFLNGEPGLELRKQEILDKIWNEYCGEVSDDSIKNEVIGEAVEGGSVQSFVSLSIPEYEGQMVRVKGTVVPADAISIEFKQGEQFLPLSIDEQGVFYFGAAEGFELTADATSEFKTTFNKSAAGKEVKLTLDVILVDTGDTIATTTTTMDVAKSDETIAEEIVAEIAKGGEQELTQDITIATKIALAKPTNLDLGGNTITNKTVGGDAIQLGAGDFTIKNGVIDNAIGGGSSAGIYVNSSKGTNLILENVEITAAYPVYLNNATIEPNCTIKSGTFVSPFDKGVAVYVEKGGHVTIEGGYFTTNGHDSSFLLNLKDAIRTPNTEREPVEFITVQGGTFVNFDPSNNAAEGAGTNFVAPGYIVGHYEKDGETKYVVEKYNNHPDMDIDGPEDCVITWDIDGYNKRNGIIDADKESQSKSDDIDFDFGAKSTIDVK